MAHLENTDHLGKGILSKVFYDASINRYGIISILLLFVGCGGGIAVGLGALDSAVQLVLLVVPTMMALAMILAVAPMKAIVYTSIAAIIIDIMVIVFNALT